MICKSIRLYPRKSSTMQMRCISRDTILSLSEHSIMTVRASRLSYINSSLTHWGRVTHICVSKLTIIGSDNGLSPDRRQAIIWTNAGIMLIRNLGTYLSEILGKIHSFSFKKMHLKMSSAKGCLIRLGLNELINWFMWYHNYNGKSGCIFYGIHCKHDDIIKWKHFPHHW